MQTVNILGQDFNRLASRLVTIHRDFHDLGECLRVLEQDSKLDAEVHSVSRKIDRNSNLLGDRGKLEPSVNGLDQGFRALIPGLSAIHDSLDSLSS